ncbi:putative DNA-binding protein [Gillisia sp. Hel_I_86]|uniref:AlbA family DNA-binding domain-containing protein n=1 Tax=Gillisia sp. Hel_I_86 TaxID=1249981 RepID=UPI00119C0256|nr:ATP-binding protein [Gillisia sp. Hel_I_86]TVZ28774.1 putative DNA-binding protein [Gillisia sp. Hel_I_86]
MKLSKGIHYQKRAALNRRDLLIASVLGFAVGILIIQPLGLSLFQYDQGGDVDNWWYLFKNAVGQAVGFSDMDQILKNILFGIMGSSLALIFYTRKTIFRLNREKVGVTLIRELLDKGENHEIEFKSTLRWDLLQGKVNKALEMVVAKTIAGFMNTEGGHLIIGVDDEGRILGLGQDYGALKKPGKDGFEQYVMQLVSVNLGTHFCPLAKVAFYQFEEKDICYVRIRKSQKPVYLNLGDRSHFFIRTGNGTRELDMPEALEYMETHLN